MPDVPFPIWFYYGALASMQWPQKVGLRRRRVVNARIADMTAAQLGDYGRVIGAVEPELACALIGNAFTRRDWQTQPTAEIAEMLEIEHEAGWQRLESIDENVPWEFMEHDTLRTRVVAWFAAEVWHGLTNARAVQAGLDSTLTGGKARATEWSSHGLAVNPESIAEDASELAFQAISAVRAFEEEQGRLSAGPDSLLLLRNERRV